MAVLTKIPGKLQTLIELFLSERRESDGGWAPVTKKDFDCLVAILGTLIAEKWAPDPDGDRPINYKLIDRTRFEPEHYFSLPYLHNIEKDPVAMEEYIDLAATNVKIALERLDLVLKMRRWERRGSKKPGGKEGS